MDDLNFSCTKCGQCCNQGPHLTFSEVLDLSENFFIQIAHCSAISYEKKPMAKELIEHYDKFCHTFNLPEKKCSLFYFVSFKAITRPSQSCPQLKNNLCSIQHKKPIHCKLAPLNPMAPEYMQLELFKEQWTPKIKSSAFKCDVSPVSPQIIKDGSIANYLSQEDFYEFLTGTRDFTDAYVKYFLDDEVNLKKNINYCFDVSQKSQSSVFYSSPIDLLKKYYNLQLMDKFTLDNFANNQIKFLSKDIKAALTLKSLNDRPITKSMQEQEKKYKEFMLEIDELEKGYSDEVKLY